MGNKQLDLAVLDELVEWMRKTGARRVRLDGVELELGVEPAKVWEAPPVMSDEDVVKHFERDKEARDALLFASSEGFPPDESE